MRAIPGAGWILSAGILIVISASPAAAQANWLFSPFVGRTFAGSTTLPDLDQGATSSQLIFGGSVGLWTDGLLAVETDFSYAPRFFESGDDDGVITNSNVATFGLDLVVAAPVSVTRESLRPYLVGGIGWMHASISESGDVLTELSGARNSVGINVGGGAIGFITPRTGIRFEIRQFRSLERENDLFTLERMSLLTFWRATVGVVIRR